MIPFNHSPSRGSGIALLASFLLFGCGPQPAEQAKEQPKEQVAQAKAPSSESASSDEIRIRLSDDAFRFAAYEGKLETVRTAIEAGNNVNATDAEKSLTPLHMAAYNGHSQVVSLLLEHGANVDARDAEGKTALLHACTGPFPSTVEILLAAGADANARESTEAFTPLMMAAGLGQLEVVRVLLRNKADKSILDDDGDSALQHAKNSGHTEIVELLGP